MQTDIRALKTHLRGEYRAKRTALLPEEKQRRDTAVAQAVKRLWQYCLNDTILIYVSTALEVDTRRIMIQAWEDGKTVAVPYCIPGTREMEFYRIKSFDDLHDGAFGVQEPTPREENRVSDLSRGLCVIPALCYDDKGYRLGYGKGYYDRFLARFGGQRVGLCYRDCLCHTLPHGRFDRAVEVVVTEDGIRKID